MAVRAHHTGFHSSTKQSLPPPLPRTPAGMPVLIPPPRDGGEHQHQPSQSRRNIVPRPRYFPPTRSRRTANSATPFLPALFRIHAVPPPYTNQRTHPAASRSPRQLVEPPRRQSQIPPQLDHRRHRGNDRSSHLRFYTSQPRGSVAPRCRRQSRRYEGVAAATTCVKCGGAIRAQHRNHPYKAGPSHLI